MEFRQLEAFAAVMSVGSITGAAKRLGRSQPAITRLVQELEADIGYALFTRNGPRVTPTEQGFLLYEEAERILAGLRRIHERAAEIARGDAQPLLIAATSALSIGLLPAALARLENEAAPMPVQLRSASPEQVVHDVLGGLVQLGVCSLPLEHRGLQVHWIAHMPCVAVLAEGDTLAAFDTVTMAQLAQRRLITMGNPYRLRYLIDAALTPTETANPAAATSASYRSALIETNSSINAQALVRAGLGVAVLEPLSCMGAPLEGVVTRPIDTHIPFYFGVITPQGRALNEAACAMVGALQAAALALPGCVMHDAAEHGALLQTTQAALSPQAPAPSMTTPWTPPAPLAPSAPPCHWSSPSSSAHADVQDS